LITGRDNWTVRALHAAFVHVSTPVSCVSVFAYILEVKRKIDEGEQVGESGSK
jgi:ribosomal protein S8E